MHYLLKTLRYVFLLHQCVCMYVCSFAFIMSYFCYSSLSSLFSSSFFFLSTSSLLLPSIHLVYNLSSSFSISYSLSPSVVQCKVGLIFHFFPVPYFNSLSLSLSLSLYLLSYKSFLSSLFSCPC